MSMEDRKVELEVARALYTFKATVAKTLSFHENDQFLIYHPATKEKNWWQVVNSEAQVGYVPSNYVTAVEVSAEVMTDLLDDLINKLRLDADKVRLTPDRRDLLTKLLSRRRHLDGDGGGGEDKALSRTPSIISIPPIPSHAEAQDVAPPVPSHGPAKPAKPKPESTPPPVPSHAPGSRVMADVHRKRNTLPRPKSAPSSHVQRRVAELTGQIGGGVGIVSSDKPTNFMPQYSVGGGKAKTPPAPSNTITNTTNIYKTEDAPEEVKAPSRRSSVQTSKRINQELVYQLVEQVRCHTDLSHEKSRLAVAVVLNFVEQHVEECSVGAVGTMLHHLQGPLAAPKPLLEQTHDAQRLYTLFDELTSCKDDAQQRSWMLHEDEFSIIQNLQQLTSILTNADAVVCRHVVEANGQYTGVVALVQFYQMETRWSIRKALLGSFRAMCALDRGVLAVLLSSVLPCELARDMVANAHNLQRLTASANLLTLIFSMGEPMPIPHFEHIGEEFVGVVLELIESPPDGDEQLSDVLITFLLSYNLQFHSDDNPLIQALSTRHTAKIFTEKILLLLNREDDPVRVLEHERGVAQAHSVLKLFVDAFSCSATAALFYTNDVKVLIDIIVRQLADLSPGDPRRHQYLCLCRVVMRNPGYAEHHHRRHDLLKCFTRIFCEESEDSRQDQKLVREISNEFPHYFKA